MCFRGSSHGWVVLYDNRSLDMFLYNPITRRHISLPPYEHVDKVILSCSPDEPNCRAIMIYNNCGLAFCCPGFSKEWIHQDSRHGELESWDLRDPQSPRAVKIADVSYKSGRIGYPRTEEEEKKLWLTNEPMEHLVVAGQDLLVVTQYSADSFDCDGLYVDGNDPDALAFERGLPSVTVDFDVEKYDPENGEVKYVEGSCLGGWALFVGLYSDAVALPLAEFPELKPNSIYFTDALMDALIDNCRTGGHDIGIFNYENKTVSSCYFPCDAKNLRKTYPATMWFFPSRG